MKNYCEAVKKQYDLIVEANGDENQIQSCRNALVAHFQDVVQVQYNHALFLADGIVFDALNELQNRKVKQ